MINNPASAAKRLTAASILLILSIIDAGCGNESPPAQTTNSSGITWKSDGTVTPGEYQSTKVIDNNFTIWWNSDSTYLYVAMKGTSPVTAGYVAIGFLPQDWTPSMQKKDTDAIIGFVAGGKATVVDTFITGLIGPHPADGKNDIEQASGSIEGTSTILEFKRKLDTGDSRDQQLEKGANKIMWAVGYDPTDNGAHSSRGYNEIDIK